MHLFNIFLIIMLSMIMTVSLTEELVLGITILLLLGFLVYLLFDYIYDFSFNQRNLALKKVLVALQDLETSIILYQMHLQEMAYTFISLQIFVDEVKGELFYALIDHQKEFEDISYYVFDDFIATLVNYERFQSEAYEYLMYTFWTNLRQRLLT